jgi:tol-pal system protein YbgF
MKYHAFFVYTLLAVLCGCAARSDILILDERLARLEGQMERQQSQIRQYDTTSKDKEQLLRNQSAGLRVQLDALKEELQLLNGRLEELDFRIKQQKTAIEDGDQLLSAKLDRHEETLQVLNKRVAQTEQYLDIGTVDTRPVKNDREPTPTAGLSGKNLSEGELYKLSKNAFDKGDFESAREGFEELIKRYPDSKNADNAQFWIGEIYYREKWYEKAIVEYQRVIKNYPKGNKVKAALLKQGYAFFNIGDKSNAKLVLKELIERYPDSNEAQIAAKKLQQM